MWWRWAIFGICGLSIFACIVSTVIDWVKGNTGPLGPHPENWWGCGIFTIILALIMFWIGKSLFLK